LYTTVPWEPLRWADFERTKDDEGGGVRSRRTPTSDRVVNGAA